jgi:hypothetical protein
MTISLRNARHSIVRRLGFTPREARLLTWGGGCLAVAGWADISLQNAAETLFLKRVGVVYLPLALLASAFLLAATAFLAARLIGQRNRLLLLPRAFLVLGISLLPLWACLHYELPWVPALLILVSKQFKTVSLVLFWTTMGDLVDGRQAKRLYAPLTAGLTVGAIAGSFASEYIGRVLGLEGLVGASAVVLASGAFFALPLRRASLLGFAAERRPSRSEPQRAEPLQLGPRALWKESRLFRVLLISTVCAGTVGPILFFQFSMAADLATQGAGAEQDLLRLYARMRGWMSAGILALQLTVTPRLYGRIGLPAAVFVSPLSYLASFIGLAIRPTLPTNIGAVAVTRLQGDAVYDPAVRVLENLFPERLRSQATALLEGAAQRSGAVFGNVIVLAAVWLGAPADGVYAAIAICVLWLAAAVLLWRGYPTLLLEALMRPDSIGGGHALSALLNPATVKALSAYLSDADEEKTRMALDLLFKAPPASAIEALALAAGRAPAHTRRLLLTALVRACDDPQRPPVACPRASAALAAILAGSDSLTVEERAMATGAYGMLLAGPLGPRERIVLGGMQRDADDTVRLAAETALQINGSSNDADDLDALLRSALASDDDKAYRSAVTELRRLLLRSPLDARWKQRLGMLVDALGREEYRSLAAEAISDVAVKHRTGVARVAANVVPLHSDEEPRTRAAVLRFIGYAQLHEQFPLVLMRLVSQDADEAKAARQGLLAMGDLIADSLMGRYGNASPRLRREILAVLHQLGLDANDARTLIDYELKGVQKAIIALEVLQNRRDAPPLLVQRLEERVSDSLHTLAVILTARWNGGGLAEIDNAIRQHRGERQRAIAILVEAVERSMTPREAARLLPLLERAAAVSKPGGGAVSDHSMRDAIRALVGDTDEVTRSLAALAVARLDAPDQILDDAGVANLVDLALQLKSIPIFERLSVEQLLDLAKLLREEQHPPDTIIVREGHCGTGMYVILEGQCEVVREEKHVAELGPTEFFGEMSVLDGEARSATVRAISSVRLLRLERADLLELMEDNAAIGIAVALSLAQRLRLRLENGHKDAH